MMKINKAQYCIVIILGLLSASCASLGSGFHYQNGIREARLGNMHSAFIELHSYVQDYPNLSGARNARFAMCEYYFENRDYSDAIRELTDYIGRYPGERNTVFAQALLYKIFLEYKAEPELLDKLKSMFFSKSIFLVFSESKIKRYKSIFGNRYGIKEYVDKIEIFRNGDLLFEIKL